MAFEIVSGVRFDSFSLVSTPKCESCACPMGYHDNVHWVCENLLCKALNKPVHVQGVYPINTRESEGG